MQVNRDGEGLENTCQGTDRRLMHATQPEWGEVPKHYPQRAGTRPYSVVYLQVTDNSREFNPVR